MRGNGLEEGRDVQCPSGLFRVVNVFRAVLLDVQDPT